MDRAAWWATVHGVTRVRYDLVTKQKQRKSGILRIKGVCVVAKGSNSQPKKCG